MPNEDAHARAREEMVRRLLDARAFRDARIAEAFRRVPRHAFLPGATPEQAYLDAPLPIGEGQTISAPHMVAMMLDALDVQPGARVLEVGGGSGYHAALLAHLAAPEGHVWSVERLPALAEASRRALAAAGAATRVTVVVADGSRGLPEAAPFDRISVACAAPAIPPPLLDQLAAGGRLLIPVGSHTLQDLLLVRRAPGGKLETTALGPCLFVPLVGEHGFGG